jgi:IPT/TIG domain
MATPTVTSLSPATGSAAGGTLVALTGTGFSNAMLVGFGATQATSIAVLSDTSLVAASPSGTGSVNVTVVTPGGISAAVPAAQFAYTGTPPSPAPPPVDPALTAQAVGTLLSIIQASNSPDAAAAQSIILRRLALQGDVVGSRVPAPRNITEIGGYFNMLETLGESAMREQTLAGILGVAGPIPSLTSLQPQPLSMVNLTNDRPAGTAQATLPLSVQVRSDFVNGLLDALKQLHAQNAALPFAGPTSLTLPTGAPGASVPADPLFYLGRVLTLPPSAALRDVTSDPLVLARKSGSVGAFDIMANVPSPGSVAVAPDDYEALQISGGAINKVPLNQARLVTLAPVLASVGFYPVSPLPVPASPTDLAWTRLSNITGLVIGDTKLVDELSLLYPPSLIAASAFAPALGYTWDGANFVA